MELTEDGTKGLGLSIQDLAVYFYTENVFITSTQPERLQRAFDVLTGLFDWIGLQTNARKMVSMECQTCHAPVHMSLAAYEWQEMGTGPTLR